MKLTGACHCQGISYDLSWPDHARPAPARRCGCSYCTRFGAIWTSHPEAALALRVASAPLEKRYRFGTGTADFLFCRRCGVVIAALDGNSGSTKAVVNINTLDPGQDIDFIHSDSDYDNEPEQARLARRAANWISTVNFQSLTDKA